MFKHHAPSQKPHNYCPLIVNLIDFAAFAKIVHDIIIEGQKTISELSHTDKKQFIVSVYQTLLLENYCRKNVDSHYT